MQVITKINHIFDSIRDDDFSEKKYVFRVSDKLKQNIGTDVGEFRLCCILICSDQWKNDGYECTNVYFTDNLEYVVVEVEKYTPKKEMLVAI